MKILRASQDARYGTLLTSSTSPCLLWREYCIACRPDCTALSPCPRGMPPHPSPVELPSTQFFVLSQPTDDSISHVFISIPCRRTVTFCLSGSPTPPTHCVAPPELPRRRRNGDEYATRGSGDGLQARSRRLVRPIKKLESDSWHHKFGLSSKVCQWVHS